MDVPRRHLMMFGMCQRHWLPVSAMFRVVHLHPVILLVLSLWKPTSRSANTGHCTFNGLQVYGYTSSDLFRTILDLFCRCDYTAPNLYVGNINRESVSDALECGLSAEMIVTYLRSHAHPSVQDRKPVVPHVIITSSGWPVNCFPLECGQSDSSVGE